VVFASLQPPFWMPNRASKLDQVRIRTRRGKHVLTVRELPMQINTPIVHNSTDDECACATREFMMEAATKARRRRGKPHRPSGGNNAGAYREADPRPTGRNNACAQSQQSESIIALPRKASHMCMHCFRTWGGEVGLEDLMSASFAFVGHYFPESVFGTSRGGAASKLSWSSRYNFRRQCRHRERWQLFRCCCGPCLLSRRTRRSRRRRSGFRRLGRSRYPR
jgi:hypothetical protein